MNICERSNIDSDLLRSFLAVAETGNVTRAGEVLGRTQSAISVKIRKLEAALSATLFHRQARGMALTEAGRLLLPAARLVLIDMDRIGDLFETPLSGRVRVGLPDDYGSSVLERVLANFAERHPNVEVFVRCGFSAGFHEAIRRDELDLAVCACDLPAAPKDVLVTERTIWVSSPARGIDPSEPVPLALFDRDCWWRDAAIGALRQSGRSYRIAYSSESVAGVKAAITAGLAVGVLAETTVDLSFRRLKENEGFPALPSSALVLLRREENVSDASEAMESAIRVAITSHQA